MIRVVVLLAELGKDVVVDGSVAKIPAQHMITTVAGKHHVYFDLPSGGQTVAYVPKEFDCKGAAVLEGRVIEVKGGGKRQKSEEVFREAHLDVAKWECLPASIDELLEQKADEKILALGKAALPGLVRHSDTPQARELLKKLAGRDEADWVKWWRASWPRSP